MAHYYILKKYSSLKLNRYGDEYMQLCNKAIDYYKEVQEKAPEVYEKPMLEKVQHFLPVVDLKVGNDVLDVQKEKQLMVAEAVSLLSLAVSISPAIYPDEIQVTELAKELGAMRRKKRLP